MSMHLLYNTNKKASLANAKVSARQQCVYKGPGRKNLRRINAWNIIHSVSYNSVAIVV